MKVWQLQEAKAKLTQLIKEAQIEPQIISRHGKNETVVMSYEAYQSLVSDEKDLVKLLRKSPLCDYEIDLDIERDKSPMRDIDL